MPDSPTWGPSGAQSPTQQSCPGAQQGAGRALGGARVGWNPALSKLRLVHLSLLRVPSQSWQPCTHKASEPWNYRRLTRRMAARVRAGY